MFNLKNIVNKITDRGRDSQPNSPGVVDDPLNNQGAEGFLCPKCMTAYPSPEELQAHYEELHNSVEGGDSPVAGFGILHQEAGYHLQRQAQGGQSVSQERLSAEIQGITNVSELQKSLMDALESKAQLQFEKESLEQRTAQLARVNAAMKSVNDEEQGKSTALKERLSILEDQLAHRESIDDAAVLRQELVQVQRVMDEMTRERERERDALHSELQKLKTAYDLLQQNSDSSEKVAELENIIKKEEVSKQQIEKQSKEIEGLVELEKNKNVELLAEVAALKKNIKELVASSKIDAQTVQQFQQQVHALSTESAAAKSDLREKSAEVESLSRELRIAKTEMESLVGKVESLTNAQTHTAGLIKDKDERLAKLAADLKRHASEGAGAAKAAVQQLAEENEARLREIEGANAKLKSEKLESDDAAAKAKNDSLQKEAKIYDLVKKLEVNSEKLAKCEAELLAEKEKSLSIELRFHAEEEMSAALNESLNELKMSSQLEREQLAEKAAECSKLQDKVDAFVDQLNSFEEQNKQLEITKASLQTSLFEKDKAYAALETEKEVAFQDIREHLMNLSADYELRGQYLHGRENELELVRQELANEVAGRATDREAWDAKQERVRITREALIEEMTKSIDDKDKVIGNLNAAQKVSDEKHAAALESANKEHDLQVKALTASMNELKTNIEKQNETIHALKAQLAASERDKAAELEAAKEELNEALAKNAKEIGELKSASDAKNQELKAMQVALDEVTGDKLVLEAHLQTSQTEQKTLMEKYYASTSDNETQRRTLDEFRRRCEDSQSGLHELGRENQILRMELEKLLGRKWTEDSDVASCHLCHKEFTLIVRKHHCRNCGQIFCNECSAKSAAVANNKKPVRVCDGCYNELAAAM